MDRLMAERTTLVIAHWLSTVRNANAIMVLENGEIIERGDHDQLLEQKGKILRALYRQETAGVKILNKKEPSRSLVLFLSASRQCKLAVSAQNNPILFRLEAV